ncbi:DUF2345 domain-containing protein [Lentzea sp. NPDC042327]|uniref:DUF2345 domain-containing protein n=1 Tax=Lentzea sp. NPDC042327 TaxID=3154801 RepID=UPI0033F282BA
MTHITSDRISRHGACAYRPVEPMSTLVRRSGYTRSVLTRSAANGCRFGVLFPEHPPPSFSPIRVLRTRPERPGGHEMSTMTRPQALSVTLPSYKDDSVRITASDSVRITANDSVRITAADSVRITAGDSVRITMTDSVRITASDSVRITATDDSVRITATDDSVRITATDDSVRITATDDSVRITACDDDSVRITARRDELTLAA